MMPVRKLHIVCLLFSLLPLFWTFNSGCVKEYSFEGGDTMVVIDTAPAPGPPPVPVPMSWLCPDCIGQDQQIESKWSFHNDSNFACGIIDTSVVNQERTAFTFFGPSACSLDTGMIIDVFLDRTILDKDLHDITSPQASFYYYDNVSPSFILISHVADFKVTIDSYIHQTRLATGTFSGIVYRANGAPSEIKSGKFKIKLH